VSYRSPDGTVTFSNVLLLPVNNGTSCFTGGVIVGNSAEMKAAMSRAEVVSVFVYQVGLGVLDWCYPA
jgi:hypothetical protein